MFQSLTGEGGQDSGSPNTRLYSQSYPSIYSPGAVIGQAAGQNGEGEMSELDAVERGVQRPRILDLEEECEDEEEEEDVDERRHNLNESAGEDPSSRHCFPHIFNSIVF